MTTEWVSLYGQQVLRDTAKTWRWFDAIGPDVTEWVLDPNDVPLTATNAISGYALQAIGTSPVSFVAGADGGAVLFTTGSAGTDGVQIQCVTEGFYLASKWPCYWGCRVKINDADKTALFAGLGITDTTSHPANSDNISFRSAADSATLTFHVEKNDLETAQAVGTLTDALYVDVEWFYDGDKVTAYVNGAEVGSVSDASSTFPNDEYLTPTLAVLAGEADANTLTIQWARAIQIRQTIA